MQLPIKNKSKLVSLYGLFSAIIAVLSFFEARLGFNFGVPGVKFGLSNIIIVLSVCMIGWKTAIFMTVLKICFSLVFSSGFSGFLFTFFGSMLSVLSMIMLKRMVASRVSAVGISVLGGFCHITAQYVVFGLVFGTFNLFRLYPIALTLSVLTSFGVGIICNLLLERNRENEIKNLR